MRTSPAFTWRQANTSCWWGQRGGKELALLIPDWMRKPPEGVEPTKDPNGWGLHKQRIVLQEGVSSR